MPVCGRCDVAYLEGETHQCAGRRASMLGAAGGVVLGAVSGAILSFLAYVFATGTRIGATVMLLGIPAGAILGAVWGSRLTIKAK